MRLCNMCPYRNNTVLFGEFFGFKPFYLSINFQLDGVMRKRSVNHKQRLSVTWSTGKAYSLTVDF
jgi:hypothetical protein